MPLSRERKQAYFAQFNELLTKYEKVFIVSVDNVRSMQMHQVRMSMRGTAEVLMGKNTMMRKALSQFLSENPGHPFEQLMPKIVGNIGFVFTNEDLVEIRNKILSNRVPAPARVGAIAPVDVFVPPGPTGCDPGQTSFFQALSIATKIMKGQIEIVSEVHLIHKGDKVEPGQAVLLQKLDIRPFDYGLVIEWVYDNGSLFDPAILDITDEILASKFVNGAKHVAALGMSIGYPTMASLGYSLRTAFGKILAIAVTTDINFKQAETIKEYLADPSKFAAASGGGGGGGDAEKEEEKEESEEESVGGGMGDMFGGGSDDDDDDDDDDW